jgi:hypothetical protein
MNECIEAKKKTVHSTRCNIVRVYMPDRDVFSERRKEEEKKKKYVSLIT